MRNSARVGEQTGQTKNRSNIAPSRASESMFGVLQIRVAVDAQVTPTLVIGKEDHNIGPAARGIDQRAAETANNTHRQHEAADIHSECESVPNWPKDQRCKCVTPNK